MALLILAAFLVYLPALNGGFIWDDKDIFLIKNKIVKAPDGLYRFWCTTEATDYWPLTYSTFWIEWRLWSQNPAGYHVTNLILHIAEVLLIWIILQRLSIPGSFLAALIFALHPVNVESVAWIAELKDMLAVLFFLLSILWYLKYEEHARPWLAAKRQNTVHCPLSTVHCFQWYCLSLAAFVLAMLGKGSVAISPVLLLGIIWWLQPLKRTDFIRTAPYFLVALALTGVNIWFQTHGTGPIRNITFAQRLLGAGGVVWFYLYKALLPINLSFVYPQWQIKVGNLLWWLPLLAALALTAVLWFYRKRWSRNLLFAWGFFCVALLPVMGFADVYFMTYSLVADHYQHIAIIAIIALAASIWVAWRQSAPYKMRRLANAIALAVVGALAFLTWRQSGLYSDEFTLYKAVLKKNPECWMAHNNLGMALFDKGLIQEAIQYYEKALVINADNSEALNNLGLALFSIGKQQEAINCYHKALKIDPNFVMAYGNLAATLAQTGQPEEAIRYLQKALRIKPDDIEIRNNLGNALRIIGQNLQALEQYKYALRLDPDSPITHNNLGLALGDAGRHNEAIEHFIKALSVNPESFETHDNLGQELIRLEKPEEAIEHFKQAMRIKPNFFRTYMYLARAYTIIDQPTEAISAAQKALQLARSQGQMEMAGQIEAWLKNYRAGLPALPDSMPARKPASLPP